jgi:gluconate 2-dehydrogenase alpha chain
MKVNYSGALWSEAATHQGFHPYIMPSANSTGIYTNPDGVQLGECVYCGYCERFACEMKAKASMQTTLLPVLAKNKNFELRIKSTVLKINLDSTGKKAVSVTYLDAQGREQEQPAEMIFLTAFGLNNVHLMLYSGIGKPYDPVTGNGVVGRNYAYQANTGATYFFNSGKVFNSFMGSGSMGVTFDDFNADNFDHSSLGFIGGAGMQQNTTGARPIQTHPVPAGTPNWGSAWKKAVAHYYQRAFPGGAQGGVQAYRGNYCDLDPTYRDIYGRPLMRITFDWGPHEHKQSAFMVARSVERNHRGAARTLRHRALSKYAYDRRRDHGSRSPHQRDQQVRTGLGRLERVFNRRELVSAKCRIQSDGHGRRTRVSHGGRRTRTVCEESRTARFLEGYSLRDGVVPLVWYTKIRSACRTPSAF